MKQIKDTIGFQIIQVNREHRQKAERALNELGIHAGQEMILMQLWLEEGLPQSQIAHCMQVEAPTITKMVYRMERTGLVERRSDPHDARISRVYLTERGRELQEPVMRVWRDLEARTVMGLSEAEEAMLRRLLTQVHQNLSFK